MAEKIDEKKAAEDAEEKIEESTIEAQFMLKKTILETSELLSTVKKKHSDYEEELTEITKKFIVQNPKIEDHQKINEIYSERGAGIDKIYVHSVVCKIYSLLERVLRHLMITRLAMKELFYCHQEISSYNAVKSMLEEISYIQHPPFPRLEFTKKGEFMIPADQTTADVMKTEEYYNSVLAKASKKILDGLKKDCVENNLFGANTKKLPELFVDSTLKLLAQYKAIAKMYNGEINLEKEKYNYIDPIIKAKYLSSGWPGYTEDQEAVLGQLTYRVLLNFCTTYLLVEDLKTLDDAFINPVCSLIGFHQMSDGKMLRGFKGAEDLINSATDDLDELKEIIYHDLMVLYNRILYCVISGPDPYYHEISQQNILLLFHTVGTLAQLVQSIGWSKAREEFEKELGAKLKASEEEATSRYIT